MATGAAATGGRARGVLGQVADHDVRQRHRPPGEGVGDRHRRGRSRWRTASFDHSLGWLATDERVPRRRPAPLRRQLPRRRAPGPPRTATRRVGRSPTSLAHRRTAWSPIRAAGATTRSPATAGTAAAPSCATASSARAPATTSTRSGTTTATTCRSPRQLARRFTVFDHWHAPLHGRHVPEPAVPAQRRRPTVARRTRSRSRVGIFEGPTIWDRLAAAQRPGALLLHRPARSSRSGAGAWTATDRAIDDYFTDAAAGHAPELRDGRPGLPRRLPHRRPHAGPTSAYGQRFIREVFRAFAQSPQWERGAFVARSTTSGAASSTTCARRSSPTTAGRPIPRTTSARPASGCPAIVASPRVAPDGVDHTRSDHTSVLRFLEWRFLGAPARGPGGDGDRWWLTKRDRHAHNLGTALGAGRRTPTSRSTSTGRSPAGGPPCPLPTLGAHATAARRAPSATRPNGRPTRSCSRSRDRCSRSVSAPPWILP